MASPELARLKAALSAMPPGTLVPRDWLMEQLADGSRGLAGSESLAAPGGIDLTIARLALLFGKRPSTVRAWVERGDFPGAYKLHGKEWRVPVSAVEVFQDRHRRTTSNPGLSAWRKVKRPEASTRSENGHYGATKRSPRGNAEV